MLFRTRFSKATSDQADPCSHRPGFPHSRNTHRRPTLAVHLLRGGKMGLPLPPLQPAEIPSLPPPLGPTLGQIMFHHRGGLGNQRGRRAHTCVPTAGKSLHPASARSPRRHLSPCSGEPRWASLCPKAPCLSFKCPQGTVMFFLPLSTIPPSAQLRTYWPPMSLQV